MLAATRKVPARHEFQLQSSWHRSAVLSTLATAADIERAFPEVVQSSWRLQALLFRSYYDAHVQAGSARSSRLAAMLRCS